MRQRSGRWESHIQSLPFLRSRQFSRPGDDIQRVFEIVDDGLGKPADDREAFSLDNLVDKPPVELAHPQRQFAEQGLQQGG